MLANETREFDAEKAQEDYEQWEKAFMGFNRADDEARPVSGYMQRVFAEMYCRLPREIRTFIRDNCRFVEIDSGEKQTFVVRRGVNRSG